MSSSLSEQLDSSLVDHRHHTPELPGLRARTSGTVAVPGEPAYRELVTPWNLAVDVRPRLVVGARTAQDVVEAVRYARRNGLTVSAQATGHGAQRGGAGGLLVNTQQLDTCIVSADGHARVGAGVKWRRVVQEAAPHGLAPLCGSASGVGVVGYTTGGGVGPMARTYGLASDRVTAFEVVTGDGQLRRVTAEEHPDLFFGLRGGKGALGVVTAVEFDLVAQPRFYGGALWFTAEHAPAALEAWRAWSEELPQAGTTSFAVHNLPARPGVPEPLAGRTTLAVRFLWTGDEASGEAVLAPLRAAAPVLLDGVRELPFGAVDAVHNDPVDPLPASQAACVLTGFPHAAAEALLDLALDGSPQSTVEVRQLGGATARPGAHPSAFCARDAAYSLFCVGAAQAPGIADHAEQLLEALGPWSGGRPMPNYTFRAEQLVDCYDTPTLVRLREAIHRYDPDGVLAAGRALSA